MTLGYICKSNGKCNIKQGSRCRACRFNACILAEMNPAAIHLPGIVNIRQLVLNIENKRQTLLSNEETYPIIPKVQPKLIESSFCTKIEYLLYIEIKIKKLREPSYNPSWQYTEISEILRTPSILAHADKYRKPSHWPLNTDQLESKIFTSNYDKQFMIEDENGPKKRHWLTIDFILALEMAKALPTYQKLDERDKIILLKQVGLVNAVIMQCFYSFVNDSNTILLPNGMMPLKIIIHKMEKFGFNQPGKLLVDIFCRCIEQQENYALVLLRHLQAKLGKDKGAKKYNDVIALIETFFYFTAVQKQVHMLPSVEMMQIASPYIESLPPRYLKNLPMIFEKILI